MDNIEIVMIKLKGCGPCEQFEPIIKNYTKEKNIRFKTIQAENMPKNIRPPYYPYFYLRKKDKVIEEWAGNSEKKMKSVIKRNFV